MREDQHNRELRRVLRAQKFRVLHVREADEVGVLDLIVWRNRQLLGWVELKVDDGQLRTAQREFIRGELRDGGKVYVIQFDGESSGCYVTDMRSSHVAIVMDYKNFDWAYIFR